MLPELDLPEFLFHEIVFLVVCIFGVILGVCISGVFIGPVYYKHLKCSYNILYGCLLVFFTKVYVFCNGFTANLGQILKKKKQLFRSYYANCQF